MRKAVELTGENSICEMCSLDPWALIRGYLADLVTWPKGPNADLKKDFSVAQVDDRQQFTNLTTGESYAGRLPITGNQQIYLLVEIHKMLEGSGKIRIQILGG